MNLWRRFGMWLPGPKFNLQENELSIIWAGYYPVFGYLTGLCCFLPMVLLGWHFILPASLAATLGVLFGELLEGGRQSKRLWTDFYGGPILAITSLVIRWLALYTMSQNFYSTYALAVPVLAKLVLLSRFRLIGVKMPFSILLSGIFLSLPMLRLPHVGWFLLVLYLFAPMMVLTVKPQRSVVSRMLGFSRLLESAAWLGAIYLVENARHLISY